MQADRTRPQIRRASRTLSAQAEVWDYEAGERIRRTVTVEVRAEEWLNGRTGRYSRRYSARESTRLGWHLCATPRQAILKVVTPVVARGGWIADLCAKAEQAPLR